MSSLTPCRPKLRSSRPVACTLFVAANQEGGQIQALQGIGFATIPTAVAQGDMSLDALQANARRWGRDLNSAGVNLNFAPVADVVPVANKGTNQPIGVLDREYGHDAESAGSHAAAFVRGMTAAGVASTAKHFPGLGRVEGNTDVTGDVVDDVTTVDDPSLGSFQATIDAGVPFVMVALATYQQIDPDHLAVFSPVVIKNMLRGNLGFAGVVMSDDLGDAAAVADVPVADRAIELPERRRRPRGGRNRPTTQSPWPPPCWLAPRMTLPLPRSPTRPPSKCSRRKRPRTPRLLGHVKDPAHQKSPAGIKSPSGDSRLSAAD